MRLKRSGPVTGRLSTPTISLGSGSWPALHLRGRGPLSGGLPCGHLRRTAYRDIEGLGERKRALRLRPTRAGAQQGERQDRPCEAILRSPEGQKGSDMEHPPQRQKVIALHAAVSKSIRRGENVAFRR